VSQGAALCCPSVIASSDNWSLLAPNDLCTCSPGKNRAEDCIGGGVTGQGSRTQPDSSALM